MADVDTDLVGIIVASVVCGILLCVLIIFAGVFCHRRLESKRRKKAMNKNPYLIDPGVQESNSNTGLESAETLSGYRPKILNSNEEDTPAAEYQELNDIPNGLANPLPDKGREENKNDEADIIVQQETTQYVNSSRRAQNGKEIVMTAVEPYRIDEPPSSQSKVLNGDSIMQEQNFELHSISHEEKPNVSERNVQGQVHISGLSEHGTGNANREEEEATVVHIIPFDDVELPLVGTTKAESHIIASSSRTVNSKPVVETVNSQSRTINYKTTVHDDEKEPVVNKMASLSTATRIISYGDDSHSDPIIQNGQFHAGDTDVISSQYEREPNVQTEQSLSRTTHFISSSQYVDREPIVQTAQSQTHTTHNIISTTQDAEVEPNDHANQSQTRINHYTFSDQDADGETMSHTRTTRFISSTQDAEIESIDHIRPSQIRTTHFKLPSQDNDIEPFAETIKSQIRTTHFKLPSEDNEIEPFAETVKSQTRTTHNIISSTQDAEVKPNDHANQSQTSINHYTFSEQDAVGETMSHTRTTRFISSTQDAEIESIDHTRPSQIRTTHFKLPSQDNEIEPFAETVKSQTRTTHYIISSNQDDAEEPIVQNTQSQTRTRHFIPSSGDAERDMIVPTAQSQTRTTHYVISSTQDDGREPNVQNTQTHFISSSLNADRGPIVPTSQSKTNTAYFKSSAQDVERDPIVQSSQDPTSTSYHLAPAYDFHTEATVPVAYSQLRTARLVEEQAKAEASRNIVIISSQTGPEGRRLTSMKMPDVTPDVEAVQRNGDSGGVVRTYTTRSNDGSIRTYTTRTNKAFVNGAYIPSEGKLDTWTTRTYQDNDATTKVETRTNHAFANDAYIPFEGERDKWTTRTYEEKTNTVDFDGEADHDTSDSSTVSSPGDTSSEGTAGMASMLVRDYSLTDGSRDNSSNQKGLGNADEYTILDYVDPNSSSSNTDGNFKSAMVKIGDVSGSRKFKKREDIDISAEKVPPVFTSTPRAPSEMTSYVQSYAYRQRKEYEGSVQYLPEKDLVTPL